MFWTLFWIAFEPGRHPRGGRGDRGGKDWYFNFQRLEGLGRALRVGCGYGRKVGSVLLAQVEKDTEGSHSVSQVPLGWALASQLCSPSYVGCHVEESHVHYQPGLQSKFKASLDNFVRCHCKMKSQERARERALAWVPPLGPERL